MSLLITGGTGFIGSHTVVELLQANKKQLEDKLLQSIIIVDNLSNSSTKVLDRIKQITGCEVTFIQADVCNSTAMDALFTDHNIDAVIHFAGLKAVGESSKMPLSYYHNNVSGTITLLQIMAKHQVKKFVFSSSATVYGETNQSPLDETMPTSATNPYGMTKLMIENVLFDLAKSDPQWSIICLRYFNPIGAHHSGLMGENPNGIPNNLLPFVSQVAVGRLAKLAIYGDDYDTADGTGVRDYIHVVDLALGHVKAVSKLSQMHGCKAINLGTGNGTSVLEIVNKFKEISGQAIPYQIVPRRAGDLAAVFAKADLAKAELDWQAERDIQTMIEDAWRWQSTNPNGY